MAAALRIVTCNPEPTLEDSMIRVLNDSFIGRLAVMNTAARALRAMGYRVTRQELNPARGSRPEVQIDRGTTQSIVPLLDNSRGRQWRNEGGKKRGYTEFKGVTVSWEEA
jgi:hypothetical protein